MSYVTIGEAALTAIIAEQQLLNAIAEERRWKARRLEAQQREVEARAIADKWRQILGLTGKVIYERAS